MDTYDEKSSILLIVTWSLSESPISIRDSFLKSCNNVTRFLISYQDNFANFDNKKYFDTYQNNHNNIRWSNRKIDHLVLENYLFGCK